MELMNLNKLTEIQSDLVYCVPHDKLNRVSWSFTSLNQIHHYEFHIAPSMSSNYSSDITCQMILYVSQGNSMCKCFQENKEIFSSGSPFGGCMIDLLGFQADFLYIAVALH